MANRLAASQSPYLQAHADNPVDWWEWCPDAFSEARRRDVPLIVSIGYAACHWCHVMAHESFEDPATAALMNEHYVCVKVDREERPDVDAVYMGALQAMQGQGGWPLTAFCDADGTPFAAGTYFPPTPRYGMPSFRQMLEGIAEAWRSRRDEVSQVSEQIRTVLSQAGAAPSSRTLDESVLAAAAEALLAAEDRQDGGFGTGAPKFPPSTAMEHLMRHAARTGRADVLQAATRTAEHMARGGMYDQLAGGFARYSVDARWVVPHFEKMLYDNALLLSAYLHLWRATGLPLAERVARETSAFLLAELRTPEGGFAASLDADSVEGEGAFAVWTPQQLVAVLGQDDAAWAARVFEVTSDGTFEHGASVLQLREDPDDPERFGSVRARLLQARRRRPQPAIDDKVVASWNGLAIRALAEAGALLGEPALLDAARDAAELLLRLHVRDGRVARVSRHGRVGASAGVLTDHADLAAALLTLYQVTGERRWFESAGPVLETILSRFGDGQGGFYDTADDAEALLHRPQDPTDTPTPSGWASAADALLTYAALTGSARHREAAERALGGPLELAVRHPHAVGWALAVAEAALDGPREVAVVGPDGDDLTTALHRTALLGTAPGAVVALGVPGDEVPELLAHRRPVVASAYVCRRFACEAPVTTPEELAPLVAAHM